MMCYTSLHAHKLKLFLSSIRSCLGIACAKLDDSSLEYSFCSCGCFSICQLLLCTNRNYLGPIQSLAVWGGGIFFSLLLVEWVYSASECKSSFFFSAVLSLDWQCWKNAFRAFLLQPEELKECGSCREINFCLGSHVVLRVLAG